MAEKEALDIVVLAGGISHERDISLRSGRRVADGLNALGHRVALRDPDASLLGFLNESRPDVVWPALHGASGEDGALRGLLELTGVPFVGSRADASRLAWSKPAAKTVIERAGVSTPRSVTLPQETFRELGAGSVLETVLRGLSLPVVVKPAQGGSAQGVTIVDTAEELPRAMVDAYTYSDVALIEQKVDGIEVSVAVVDTGDGPSALPAVEIEPVEGAYTFDARYNAGETRFYVPARLDEGVTAAVAAAAVTAHRALGLRHLSRIDLIVDAAGTPWFLEANVLPGLTETSIMPQAITASGQEPRDVYAALALAAIADA
ncbi:D-alanine--D-alanine ligase family protein [Leifsonia sp. RAF41]|uniref:D-alanine--D-alanine ligase family protein n=1 Tax=Leifsonia sp. RAF41 TaxID=3233056 RepID=UPI003F96EEB2